MNKRYVVRLNEDERNELLELVRAGKAAARKLRRARVLLKVDQGESGAGWTDEQTAEALDCGVCMVATARQRFVQEGLKAAISRRKQVRPSKLRKLDGAGEARLLAIGCGNPPEGRARWTMRLLADELVTLEVVDEISPETVRRTLKKMSSSLT